MDGIRKHFINWQFLKFSALAKGMVFIMKDPYQILNITPDATDEQVREAYRSLARKYQPENYENSPLADMAAKKMDEINGAYDAIPWEISAPKSTPTASMMRKPCSTASHRRHAVQSGIF